MTGITDKTLAMDTSAILCPPRFIAFYLPQFYPTPYNDDWWGKGYTEWTNVTRGRPRFLGHYQPHLPADLGFYDLRLAETRAAQAELAREYGIYGFCYYHYWFHGRRILERPLDEVLASGRPDFPFCICWANESWTRAWEGRAGDMLVQQHYSTADDIAHIRHLLPMLSDHRYIRVEEKPLILIYRIELLPNAQCTAEIWRSEARKAGLGELFLVNVESNYVRNGQDCSRIGFDAAMRFQPNSNMFHAPKFVRALRALKSLRRNDRVFDYRQLYKRWAASAPPSYRSFECVTPMWDNSARLKRRAHVFKNSTPQGYEIWLREAVARTPPDGNGNKWVFVNAWNEWGEGCHLEPCQKWGRAYLEATKRVHDGVRL